MKISFYKLIKQTFKKTFCCKLDNKNGFTTTVNFTTSTNGHWLKQHCRGWKESCKDAQTETVSPRLFLHRWPSGLIPWSKRSSQHLQDEQSQSLLVRKSNFIVLSSAAQDLAGRAWKLLASQGTQASGCVELRSLQALPHIWSPGTSPEEPMS